MQHTTESSVPRRSFSTNRAVRLGLSVLTLVMFSAVLLTGPQSLWAQQYEVDVAGGKLVINTTPLTSCNNRFGISIKFCPDCGCYETPDCELIYQSPGQTQVATGTTSNGSLINNIDFNYHHYAYDYRVGHGSASCTTCSGSPSAEEGLLELALQRRHRFRNFTEYGSFGPGVYTSYDSKVFFHEQDGGLVVRVFDPTAGFDLRLVDGTGEDTVRDGIFSDPQNKAIREARLVDAGGTLVAELADATELKITSNIGTVTTFEIIDLAGDDPSDVGLVGRWNFEQRNGSTALDSSGNDNDGAITDAQWEAGAIGAGGMRFEGTTDKVLIGQPAEMDIEGDITLSAWVKVNDREGERDIISRRREFNYFFVIPQIEGVTLRVTDGDIQIGAAGDADDDGYIDWFEDDGNGGYINGPELGGTVPYTLTDDEIGRWIHITAVYDGNTWYLYRNGALVQANAHAVGPVSTNADWVIGEFNNLPQQTNGDEMVEIDDVRVYNRAMIQDEVRELATASPMDAENRLVARWDFDNGASDTSLHGTDHVGTLNGGAVVAGGTLTLDGVDDEMRFASTTDISNTTVNKRTVLVRFKVDDASSTAKQVIYDEGGSSKGFNIYIEDGSLYVGGWNRASDPTYWAGAWLSTDTIVSGQWHEVALVFDAESTITANALQAYLDGELFGMADGSQVTAHNDGNAIGRVNYTSRYQDGTTGGANPFKGEIDYVHVISANASDEDPTLNLVAAWELNGDASDTSPNGLDNSGTLNGTTSFSSGALVLSGSGRVNIPTSTDLNNTLNEQVMIQTRFKVTNPSSSNAQVIYETGGSSRGMNVYVQSGNLYVGGYNTVGSPESGWSGTWLSTDQIQADTWHEVQVVLNGGDTVGSGALEGYLDGVRFGEGDGSQIWPNTGLIGIGAARQDTRLHSGVVWWGRQLTGSIDYVRVYKRMAATRDFIDPDELKVYAGRLKQIKDRNGYSLDVAYKTFTDFELAVSPDRQWQIDTVTDPYGRSMSYTYRNEQVGGLWVVEKVDLPNGEDVDYLYEDDVHLTKVQHADGTESTFAYGADAVSQTVTIDFDDASADPTHRKKTAYLTQNFVLPGGETEGFEAFNQAAMLIRMLENGSGEVAYLNLNDPNELATNINKIAVYEGAGKLRQINGQWSSRYYKDGWALNTNGGQTSLSGTMEDTYAFSDTDGSTPGVQDFDQSVAQKGNYPLIENERGERVELTYWDADGIDYNDAWVRFRDYEDGTGETFSYNEFKQITRYKDREDRVTLNSYDVEGNLTAREVGLISNGAGGQTAQPEYAKYEWSYYSGAEGPAVSGITGAASPQPANLRKSYTDANGNVTHYVYNADRFLVARIDPADAPGDDRAVTSYTYDTSKRLETITDPLGRVTTFAFDARDRQTSTTYHDGSTEKIFYANELPGGAGTLGNLVVAMKDRNDNYTQIRYDGHGRVAMKIGGITSETDALNQAFIEDPAYHDVEVCGYLAGTDLKTSCVSNGERVTTAYDFRHRPTGVTVHTREAGTFPHTVNGDLVDVDGDGSTTDDDGKLESQMVFRDNLPFASIDPYGRATFFAYRPADSALIRIVKEAARGGTNLDPFTATATDVENLTRDLDYEDAASLGVNDIGGAPYIIVDYVLNDVGQVESIIDPRNVQHDIAYDSRGRGILQTQAVGTSIAAKTETIYDAQSNVTTLRTPRFFAPASGAGEDPLGSGKAYITMTYTGRNLLKSRTVAAGDTTYDAFVTSGGTSGEGAKATETFNYYLDGRMAKRTDFRGNDAQYTASEHEWLTIWRACCTRLRAQIDPAGNGRAIGTDVAGNTTHRVAVEDLISDVQTNTNGQKYIVNSDNGGPGIWDVPDAKTLAESTTRFDSKHRPVASTVWLEPLGEVDPNDAPILYGGSIQGGANAQTAGTGIGAGDGLTTLFYYSEDLHEVQVISAGVEGPPNRGSNPTHVLVHQFSGAPTIDLQPLLNELSNDGIEILDLDNTNASAVASINPEGEISAAIMDGAGRVVASAWLDPTSNNPITWSTTNHDRVVNVPNFGDVLEVLTISGLDNVNRGRVDGMGRVIQTIDAEDNAAFAVYNNAGNLIRTRDANSVGSDRDFDARSRMTSSTDTQSDTRSWSYNLASQVLTSTDGKSVTSAAPSVYDARGRLLESTTRLSALDKNTRAFDPNSNLLSITDAESGTTNYEYDSRNLRTATNFPGHDPADTPGDLTGDYDRYEYMHDGLRRLLVKTDPAGDTATYLYDLASRTEQRDYRTKANSTPGSNGVPTGTIADSDVMTYDDASRLLTAVSGRYTNTVARTYDTIGRRASEALTIGGQTYTIGYDAFDDDSRLTTLTYPDGSQVKRTYTDRNQREETRYDADGTGGGASVLIADFGYDAGMRETTRALGNGLDTAFAYRDDNLLESITVETAPGSDDRPGLSMSYSYDANKNLTAEDFNNAGVMDRYGVDLNQDAKDRLTSWTRDATTTSLDSQTWNLSLEHDWEDTTVTDGSSSTTESRTFNPVHEILEIDPDDDPMTANELELTHDAKGNLSNDDQGRAFVHDFDNQLSSVTVSPGASRGTVGTHSYAYDALRRRVSKTINSVATVYIQSGAQVLAEYTIGALASAPNRKYIYGVYIDEPIAMIDASGASEDTYYYHRNRQYSIIGLSDDTGTVVERYAYNAYGDPTILAPDGTTVRTTSSYGNPYLHTGRRYDDESAMYYYRARYYDALLGRFLERDPLGYPDGLNTYAAYHMMFWGLDPWGLQEGRMPSMFGGSGLWGVGVNGGSMVVDRPSNDLMSILGEKETRRRQAEWDEGTQGPFAATGSAVNDHMETEPGFKESLIPIWGAFRLSVWHYQQENYWTACGYGALAIADVFIVRSLLTASLKIGWRGLLPAWGKWGYMTGLTKPHFYWEVLKKGWHAWDGAIAAMTRAEIRYFLGLKRYWIPMIYLSRGLATIEGAGKNCFIAMYNSTSRSWFRLDYFIITRLLGDMVAPEPEDDAPNEAEGEGHEVEVHGSHPGWRPSGGGGYTPQ